MGYCYYGNYAQYFEVGRVEAMRKVGMSYKSLEEKGVMLPVSEFKVNNIFIPVNFTNETKQALEEALYIQDKTAQNVDIKCHYVFELPLGHEKSGKSDKEFAEVLERQASKKFKKMKRC